MRFSCLVLLGCLAQSAIGANSGRLIAELDLNTEPPASATTLAFVSETGIAIARYPGVAGPRTGLILNAEFRNGRLRVLQRTSIDLDRDAMAGELFAVSHGKLLSKFSVPPRLYSGDLQEISTVPLKVIHPPEHQANFLAGFESMNSWSLYHINPTFSLARSGRGEVLSVTDDFVLFRSNDKAYIESIDRAPAGSFAVPPPSDCYGKITILGRNRLMMSGCNKANRKGDTVVDFTGKELVRLRQREGWGFRFGQSSDGTRILFDNYTRIISFGEKVSEFFTDLVTLGMGIPTESTGEIIRVVDSRTAGICFELNSPDHLFGNAGEYHADISPSGTYVALITNHRVGIYQLPNSCAT